MDELNKPQWYEVQHVEEIEGFDPDQYGNVWHNVKFRGVAETAMWLAKETPEVKKYYGHLETTKTGKRIRFKRDQVPEDEERPDNAKKDKKQDAYLKDVSSTPIQIYNGSLTYAKEAGLNIISDKEDRQLYLEYVKDITDEMLRWIDNIRRGDKDEAEKE